MKATLVEASKLNAFLHLSRPPFLCLKMSTAGEKLPHAANTQRDASSARVSSAITHTATYHEFGEVYLSVRSIIHDENRN